MLVVIKCWFIDYNNKIQLFIKLLDIIPTIILCNIFILNPVLIRNNELITYKIF